MIMNIEQNATEYFESEHNFKLFTTFAIDKSTGNLICDKNKASPCTCVYAIIVDDVLKYIGKSTDVAKRINYYRTSWNRTTHHSDKKKSDAIFEHVSAGSSVVVMYLPVFRTTLTRSTEYNSGRIISEVIELIDYSTVEEKLIKRYQPEWNSALK